MISIIITAFKEANSIKKALQYLADPKYSGFVGKIQVVQISPDKATLDEGEKYLSSLENPNLEYLVLKDENIGKPHALNMGLKKAKGDILVLTDGDVFFSKGSLSKLIEGFEEKKLDAACGNVISINRNDYFMGYISHLMTEAANHKRQIKLNNVEEGIGTKLIEKSEFFPLSGYMLIFNKIKLEKKLGEGFVFPTDCLVDDAYLSYVVYNYKLKLGYIPEAEVKVKFPTHYSDYFKQKKRSTGGYVQLWKYGVVKNETKSRSFWHELRYFWFPIKYAFKKMKNDETSIIKKLLWSLTFYPLRLWLWIQIWWERKFTNKNFTKTWVRIESTKK